MGRRTAGRPKRADARRNEEALLEAAAAVFVKSGVDAPVRDIAAEAGVGMGTIYRHFPTRADLVIAVYRHQVEACAEAGPALLASSSTPHAALTRWVGLFVDFLTTKHGLAAALQSDSARFETLHAYFLDRLVPVCAHCSTPLPPRARFGPAWTPSDCCVRSATCASAAATRTTTRARWSACSIAGLLEPGRLARLAKAGGDRRRPAQPRLGPRQHVLGAVLP